jgi:hypothetical protein
VTPAKKRRRKVTNVLDDVHENLNKMNVDRNTSVIDFFHTSSDEVWVNIPDKPAFQVFVHAEFVNPNRESTQKTWTLTFHEDTTLGEIMIKIHAEYRIVNGKLNVRSRSLRRVISNSSQSVLGAKQFGLIDGDTLEVMGSIKGGSQQGLKGVIEHLIDGSIPDSNPSRDDLNYALVLGAKVGMENGMGVQRCMDVHLSRTEERLLESVKLIIARKKAGYFNQFSTFDCPLQIQFVEGYDIGTMFALGAHSALTQKQWNHVLDLDEGLNCNILRETTSRRFTVYTHKTVWDRGEEDGNYRLPFKFLFGFNPGRQLRWDDYLDFVNHRTSEYEVVIDISLAKQRLVSYGTYSANNVVSVIPKPCQLVSTFHPRRKSYEKVGVFINEYESFLQRRHRHIFQVLDGINISADFQSIQNVRLAFGFHLVLRENEIHLKAIEYEGDVTIHRNYFVNEVCEVICTLQGNKLYKAQVDEWEADLEDVIADQIEEIAYLREHNEEELHNRYYADDYADDSGSIAPEVLPEVIHTPIASPRREIVCPQPPRKRSRDNVEDNSFVARNDESLFHERQDLGLSILKFREYENDNVNLRSTKIYLSNVEPKRNVGSFEYTDPLIHCFHFNRKKFEVDIGFHIRLPKPLFYNSNENMELTGVLASKSDITVESFENIVLNFVLNYLDLEEEVNGK